jgi:signal transduction histidine kinase
MVLEKQAVSIAGGDYAQRVSIARSDEIGSLSSAFNVMTDAVQTRVQELEAAAAEREMFIRSMAHEIKSPMTTIVGYVDVLERMKLTPEQSAKGLLAIRQESKRLNELSSKLLDLFVMRNGENVHMDEADIPALLERVCVEA